MKIFHLISKKQAQPIPGQYVSLLSQSMIIFLLLSLFFSFGVSPAQANDQSIAFYALSRGRGVPDATREALKQIRTLFTELHNQGEIVKVKEKRMGIEGERRICAEFIHENVAQREWVKLQDMTRNLDLANLKKERCD